jgi:hypothetical protein
VNDLPVIARRALLGVFVLVTVAGCNDGNTQAYKEAAVAAGLTVAAVGVYRAVTRDCWARCSPGYLCNEETGLCELGECLPGCEYGTHCARDVRGDYRCVSDAGNHPVRSSVNSAPITVPPADAGVATDAAPQAVVATPETEANVPPVSP